MGLLGNDHWPEGVEWGYYELNIGRGVRMELLGSDHWPGVVEWVY
jgi:hypothetical protein